jgi:hypothetical protein
MQSNIGAVREAAGTESSLIIVVKALGFGKDDPTGSILDPMQRLNMEQNVTALTGSGMITVQGNSQNIPTHTGNNADGSPPIKIYVMEARLNAKEFHCIDTVKCGGKGVSMEWYESIGVHGSMWGVFIPPASRLSRIGQWDSYGTNGSWVRPSMPRGH